MNLRFSLRALLAVSLFHLALGHAEAANFTVKALSNLTFVPSNLTISVGDTVTFQNQGGLHNVIEDGGAFRCAEGCDGQGGSGEPSAALWSFTLTFSTPGTVGYYCDVHGSPGSGMIGRIQVVAPGSPGTVELAAEAYSAGEGSGGTTILVRRTGGVSGAVAVKYDVSPGSASAGEDFTPVAGTLSWADGDGAVKAFSIAIRDDGLAEGNETVRITLSQPSGGASLGRASALLTLVDDDERNPPVPTGPLDEAEVACDAARLGGLLGRIAVAAPRSGRPPGLALSFTASSDFAGLATTPTAEGEAVLTFSTNPEETTLLRNPARPQLFSLSATRNDLSSDSVAPGAAGELRVSINPTLDAHPPAGNLLAIDNLAGPAGRPADAKPGRGLAALLAPCHRDFGPEDVHLFRVLPRLARGEAAGASGWEVSIYRAGTVDRYRLDLDPLDGAGAKSGRLAVELEVVRTAAGDLSGGTLRRLGPCAAGQTDGCSDLSGLAASAALALFKPVASGTPPPTPYRVSAQGPAQVEVDLAELLAGTTWRRPLE